MKLPKFKASHPDWDSPIFSEEWGEDCFQKREFYPFCFPVGFSGYPKDGKLWKIQQYTGFKDKKRRSIYYGDTVFNEFLNLKLKVDMLLVARWIIDEDKANRPTSRIVLVEE